MSKYFNKIGFKSIEQVLAIDIETATIEKELKEGTPLYDSWKYKMRNEDVTSFDEYNISFKEKGPLYQPFGKVVSIVMAYCKDGKILHKDYTGDDEKVILEEFFKDFTILYATGKRFLLGFSHVGYDIPFLAFRSMVHGLEVPPSFDVAHQKEWNMEYCIDLNLCLRGTAFASMSLLNAAVAFGLPSPKQSLEGSEVSKLYYSKDKNRLKKISEYCTLDVITTIHILAKILKIELPQA